MAASKAEHKEWKQNSPMTSIDSDLVNEMMNGDAKCAEACKTGIGYYKDGTVAWGLELLAEAAFRNLTLKNVYTTYGVEKEDR